MKKFILFSETKLLEIILPFFPLPCQLQGGDYIEIKFYKEVHYEK